MSVGTTNTSDGPFTPNGSVTEYSFTFTALSSDDVKVVSVSSGVETEVSSSLYSVVLNSDAGGVVTYLSAPAADSGDIFILLDPSFEQNTEFENGSAYIASAHNAALDRSVLRAQVLRDDLGRAPKVPRGETAFKFGSFVGAADGDHLLFQGDKAVPVPFGETPIGNALSVVENAEATFNGLVAQAVVLGQSVQVANFTAGILATNPGENFTIIANNQFKLYTNGVSPDADNPIFVFPAEATAQGAAAERNIRSVLDAAEPINRIPREVVIEKRREDFIEFGVYSAIDSTGGNWIRHFLSTRLLPGSAGAPDYTIGTLALLFSSVAVPIFAATGGSGISSASATSTQAAGAATRTGTWIGPQTISGVADSYYTTTPGDTIEYSLVCNAGDVVYSSFPSAFSNGGVVAATVETGGSEIAAGDYLCPLVGSERIFSTRQENSTRGVAAVFRAPSAATYTITFQLSTTSPAGNRLYTASVEAYAALTGTSAAGSYGSITSLTTPFGQASLTYHTGHTFVIDYPTCTRIDFHYWQNTVCGEVSFQVFDSSGDPVTGLTTTDLDMFGSSSEGTASVMSGKPLDSYKLHVFFKNTRNAAATDNRLYFLESTATNEESAGVVGSDTFNILDMPTSPAPGSFGTNVINGPGNHFYSTEWREPSATEWAAGDNFVGGVHGEETALTNADLTVKVDGVAVDWDGAVAEDQFIGSEITIEYSSTLQFPGTSTDFATLSRKLTFLRGGVVVVETVRTLTAAATMGDDFILMLQAPNGGGTQSDSVGGGFEDYAIDRDGNFVLNTSAGTSTASDPRSITFANWNGEYANYVQLLNASEVQEQYVDYLKDTNNVLLQDNASTFSKAYLRSAGGSQPADGADFPSGHVSRVVKIYRTLPSRDTSSLLAS